MPQHNLHVYCRFVLFYMLFHFFRSLHLILATFRFPAGCCLFGCSKRIKYLYCVHEVFFLSIVVILSTHSHLSHSHSLTFSFSFSHSLGYLWFGVSHIKSETIWIENTVENDSYRATTKQKLQPTPKLNYGSAHKFQTRQMK